jgi:hypothetical protein
MRNLISVQLFLLGTMAVALSQVSPGRRIEGVPSGVPLHPPAPLIIAAPKPPTVPVSTIQGAPFSAEVLTETVRTFSGRQSRQSKTASEPNLSGRERSRSLRRSRRLVRDLVVHSGACQH